MKNFFPVSLILLLSLIVWSCSDNSTGSDSEVNEASDEKQFVWNAMNYWYFWQEDVPELADDQQFFESEQAFHDYLINFTDAEALFYDLRYETEDDFSFFIPNFEEFQQAQQGISTSFGFKFGLVRFDENSNDIFGYVQYVIPDSPAEDAGLSRGDIFTGINGTTLTINNFQSVLSGDSYNLAMANFENGTFTETGETVSVDAVMLQEDPVFISKILEAGASKVGYLMYNAFQRNSHQKLNEVMSDFLSEGIDELVVDLRYNGGGAVITSAILASMISGLNASDDFARFTFNSKRSEENETITFLDEIPIYDENEDFESVVDMNQLSLDRVYFLTGRGTASASEVVINGLEPFMDVILIGRQTVGKDDGSLTLYDAPPPYTNSNSANPDHKFAIQPIVLKIVNTNGRDYPDGFIPHFEVNELSTLENMPPLGDENDPLFARALQEITGAPVAKAQPDTPLFRGEIFKDSRDLQKFGKEMYIVPEQISMPGLSSEKTLQE